MHSVFRLQEGSIKGVTFQHKNHKKIEPILEKFDRLQIIGDFHSHTQFGVTKGLPIPSDEDIKEMKDGQVYLMVAINNNEKHLTGDENPRDGAISGSVGGILAKDGRTISWRSFRDKGQGFTAHSSGFQGYKMQDARY